VKIPKDLIAKERLYSDLVKQCTASRKDRFNFYQVCRNYYLFGSQDGKGAPYNKIGSTVDTLCSFIYSPDTLRFSLHLGTESSIDDIHKSVPLSKEVTEQWRVSRTHLLYGTGVKWASVYGAMMMKSMWMGNRVRSYLVEPHQFGVLREDIPELADQEAFTHHYTITKTELEGRLEGNRRKGDIMERAGGGGPDKLPELDSGLQRLLVGSPVGGVSGSIALAGGSSTVEGGIGGRGTSYDYIPVVEAELIDMCDLYVWNDETDDYQVITRAAPDVYIYDRSSEFMGHVKGRAPFSKIQIDFASYDYFWNTSFVAKLAWLQDWRTTRVMQIRTLMDKQVDPPFSITGGVGITEEKLSALRAAGGMVPFPTPNAKVQSHAPEMPADLFADVSQIDTMFDDVAGIGHVLQGKGEAGVRSRGQADLMARLGSARPKDRAIAVEESAEEVAGLILRLVQDHSDQRFEFTAPGPEGKAEVTQFIAEQFTRDYEVKVDAHSSSPIFVEDRKHDAITLLEAKAIDRATLLDMFDPPNLQDLQERLKVIEKQEAAARKEELAMMQQQGAHRGGKK